jgi:molybdate transport system substrate-binding protein
MKKIIFTLVLAMTVVMSYAQTINVAAAANLSYVMEDMKNAYHKTNKNAKINIVYGSSGTLTQQISNGANYDIFMSADDEFPLVLQKKGLTYGGMKIYAYGKLALYSTVVDAKKGLAILNDADTKKIAICNPLTAPYGKRSVELLTKHGMYQALKPKLVVADNISQAAQYAFTGNADIAFVALSLTLTPEMQAKGTTYIFNPKLYSPIKQGCILIKKSTVNTGAAKFMKFFMSPAADAIWLKYGYSLPK